MLSKIFYKVCWFCTMLCNPDGLTFSSINNVNNNGDDDKD